MFRAPASGGAASLSRCCSIFMWVGRQRAQGFHRMCPGRRRSKRVPRCGAVCVRIPGSNGVRQPARWFHRARPWRGAPSAHACCRPGIPRPCASTETWYPHGVRVSGNARGKWSSSASGFGVSGPGEFHSSEWRSAEHVDNRLRSPEPQQFCGIGSAPCTTHSYAAIGL